MQIVKTSAGVDISSVWAAQIPKGYTTAALVEVYGPGQNKLSDSTVFQVVDGSITVDSTADIHRRLDKLRLVDLTGELVPTKVSDLFSPVSGNEVRVYTGLEVPGYGNIVLPQGVFVLEGADVEDSAEGLTVSLSAYDRAHRIGWQQLEAPILIPASSPPTTTALTAVQALLAGLGTQAPLVYVLPGYADPQLGIPETKLPDGTDRWKAGLDILASIGWTMFFDEIGWVQMRPIPDPNAAGLAVDWTYSEGSTATILGLARGFSNEPVYNVQIVTGSNTAAGFPARGIAEDTDPLSPTWIGGPFGRKPEFTTMQMLTTDAQAAAAALGRLNQRKGVQETMEIEVVPNPAHEAFDVIAVNRALSKVASQYIVDKFNLGLGVSSGPMKITCRPRRI